MPCNPDSDLSASQLTRLWVERLVVGEGLCPFAHPVMAGLAIRCSDSQDLNRITKAFTDLLTEVAEATPKQLPTALFVVPHQLADFDEYWNWSYVCEQLLIQMGYEGLLQLATFHPEYRFDGEDENDASHFTNRSPFPMLHIIREADIERALASVDHPERIPERNQRHMRRMGVARIAACLPELRFLIKGLT